MPLSTGNIVVVVIASVTIIICSICIIIATKFQKKQKKKYNEVLNIVKEKEGEIFKVKDGLTKEDISKIDSKVNLDKLMQELYNTYVKLETKIKKLDSKLDNILVGYLKEFYINKIENFKENGYADITDGIELINYSITEYSKEKLKFRVNINCFSYKTINNEIVSGSNLEKIQRIIILTYENIDNKWLISAYDKVYEKKLSE